MTTTESEVRFLTDPYLQWANGEGIPIVEDFGVDLLAVESDQLDGATRAGLRTLWARAFGDRFSDLDAEHAFGRRVRAVITPPGPLEGPEEVFDIHILYMLNRDPPVNEVTHTRKGFELYHCRMTLFHYFSHLGA